MLEKFRENGKIAQNSEAEVSSETEKQIKMIVMICGLIGAGKTTYAKNNYQYVTDFDEILSKEKQIEETLRLHQEGKTVAHITCVPTRAEQMAFNRYSPEMVWINTSPEQAMKNVIKRGRSRDMTRLREIEKSNTRFLKSKDCYGYKWILVK